MSDEIDSPSDRQCANGDDPLPVEAPRLERLAKFLAAAGVASRRESEELIRLGRVTVDGEMITEVGRKIDPERADIRFDELRVRPEPKVYWWINKPKGVLSTSKDTHGRRTVVDLLPRTGKRLYCVGRLDEESTGLLLMTNDGEMALRLTHPRYGVSKTYIALVAGRVAPETMTQMTKGVWLAEGKARVGHVKFLGALGQASRLQIVLREGKNREIRRMFAKLGHKVMSLHRTAVGPIKIKRIKIGEARPATPEEIFELRKVARLVKGPMVSQGQDRKQKRGRRTPAAAAAPPSLSKRSNLKRAPGKRGTKKFAARGGDRPSTGVRKGPKKPVGRHSVRRRNKKK